MMTITVYGSPAAQGSKSFKGLARNGKAILAESSKKVKPWRQDVMSAAIDAMCEGNGTRGVPSGPMSAHFVFTLSKPKSAPKRRRTWPDRTPDIDKLCRSTMDALTKAGVWEDDARVVRLVATKCYPGEGADSLHIPGCVIHISEVKE